MKIGFYGSSLCRFLDNAHSSKLNYKSYIRIVKDRYGAEIVHLGQMSASYWDVILIQYKELLENKPDIAVFVWPGLGFLYNKNCREIGPHSASDNSALKQRHPDIWPAVKHYYDKLYDREKDRIERLAAFKYFDELLSTLTDCKIVHLWEGDYEYPDSIDLANADSFGNYQAPYQWRNGSQIDGALLELCMAGQWPRRPTIHKIFANDPRCNHLEGSNNELLADWICSAIDTCQSTDMNSTIREHYRSCLIENQVRQ